MLNFLKSFKPIATPNAVNIDNNIFKFHCKVTVCLLVAFSVLVTSKQYFGDPIKCLSRLSGVNSDLLDTYCWIYGTYTIKKHLNRVSMVNEAAAYPGVGPISKEYAKSVLWGNHIDEEIITQKYYQFVCIVFGLQALLFYFPRFLWKSWENGRLAALVKDIGGPIVTSDWTRERKSKLVHYFLSKVYNHNIYAAHFMFCEVLNLCNIYLQIFLIDWYLGGQFANYGHAVVTFAGTGTLPMDSAFPKMTKCNFLLFGPSGDIQERDILCILPLNILNEKLFVIMWFWFMFLLCITTLNLVYRIFILCTPSIRIYLLMIQARYISKKSARSIVNKLSYGDWFLLHQLGKNLNPVIFKELITELGNNLRGKTDFSFNADITEPI